MQRREYLPWLFFCPQKEEVGCFEKLTKFLLKVEQRIQHGRWSRNGHIFSRSLFYHCHAGTMGVLRRIARRWKMTWKASLGDIKMRSVTDTTGRPLARWWEGDWEQNSNELVWYPKLVLYFSTQKFQDSDPCNGHRPRSELIHPKKSEEEVEVKRKGYRGRCQMLKELDEGEKE